MNERVRVMLLLSSLHGGGAERVAVHLLNRCDPTRVDLRMGLLRKSGPFLAEADSSRIDAAPIGSDWLASDGDNSSFYRPGALIGGAVHAPANLSRMIRAHRPQVVMSFLKGMSVLTYFVVNGLGAGRPRWIAREGNNTDAVIDDELANPAGRALIKSLTRRCYRAADCFLANSHEMAEGLRRALDLDARRIRVIHNPIDIAKVQRLAAEPIHRPQTRSFVLAVGRLEHQKGHDVLLEAFAASEAASNHDLVILGMGSREAELKRQAASLGITSRVKFLGFAANPWAWIARAALFVLPSRWEGFPSVAAEALACSAPALVTACDFGPREVIEHGVSGWVTKPDCPTTFRRDMDCLLTSPRLTERFRKAGPARAANFDIARMVEAYTRLFVEQAAVGQLAVALRA